jgi:hypothetical protein
VSDVWGQRPQGEESGEPAQPVPPPWPPQPGAAPSYGQPTGDQPGPPAYGQPGWGQAPYGQPGWGPPGYPPAGYPPRTSGKATTVLVLGIASLVSFFGLCGIGVVPAIVALVLARGADREIAASGGALTGEGQVQAGRIMSWITVALTVLALVVVAAFIAIAVSSSQSSGTVTF